MDFQVVTFDPITGVAQIGMPTVPRVVRGINKLIQMVVLEILKNGGQDVLNPGDGSGIRSMIGQFNFSDPQEIRVELTKRTKLAQSNILQNQISTDAPAVEKLKSLSVINIVVDPINNNTLLNLKIVNEAGQTTEVIV